MSDSPSYADLIAQRRELDKQIEQARAVALSGAIANVRQLVEEFNLTEADVFGRKRMETAISAPRRPVAPKYRDPATGATWTGRGKPPAWIADKEREQYLIVD